jgi:hypothetical protein
MAWRKVGACAREKDHMVRQEARESQARLALLKQLLLWELI